MKLKRIAPLGMLALLLTALLLVACAPAAEPPVVGAPVAEPGQQEPLSEDCLIVPGKSVAQWQLGVTAQEVKSRLGSGRELQRTENLYVILYDEQGLIFVFNPETNQATSIALLFRFENPVCRTMYGITFNDPEGVLNVLGEPDNIHRGQDGRTRRSYSSIGLSIETARNNLINVIGVFLPETN